MTKSKNAPGYVQNDDYSQEDWNEVSANPALTDAELAQLGPAQEVLPPDIYATLVNRGGRPKSETPKVSITIRLDQHIVEAFKAAGPGWQTRINDALARSIPKSKRPVQT